MPIDFSYSENMAAGVAGAIVDTEPKTLISRTVETAAGVGFGLPVARGAADDGCKVMEAGETEVVGFTVLDRTTAPSDTAADTFAQYESARLMRAGVLWVTVTDAGGVAPGDPVWVTLATGSLSNADVGGAGGLNLPGCRWESTAANGALAKLRINLDVPAVAGAV